LVDIRREAKNGLQRSQEGEAQAMTEVRNVTERLGAQLQAVVEESGRLVLAEAKIRRANEQLRAEVGGLKCWNRIIGGFRKRTE
jgi:transposase-like protein